jgi:uncharacterized oxidoreductase
MQIQGNTILITGGATGIGYAFAEALLKNGNKVIICGRREDKLKEAKKNHPELVIRVCDVSDEKERQSLFEWTTSNFPDLNIIINNAGIQRTIDLTKGVEELKNGADELKINLEAPIYLSAQFIPFFADKKDTAIINVSSGLAFTPMARMPIYCATKAALHTYSMTLRHQLKDLGIKIFEVVPPMILDTELNMEGRAKSGTNLVNFKTPTSAEFVEVVMNGIQKDEFEIGYGSSVDLKKASREELDKRFEMMNNR